MIFMIGVALIVSLILAIIYLTHQSSGSKKSREEFLRDLQQYVEGRQEVISAEDGSFRIIYDLENVEFFFEDIFVKGFSQEGINKAFLKVATKTPITMSFLERDSNQKIITGEVRLASRMSKEADQSAAMVVIPKVLKEFKVYSSHPNIANKFLEDKKVVGILSTFKNSDQRGFPSLSFRVSDGVIILEFSLGPAFRPNLQNLRTNVASIEDFSDKLLYLAQVLDRLYDKDQH